ncbi:MAG: elongation factor 4 [Parcubacteria group bacterium CG2_30_36_18]|uniref:Elongation factor 4 n=4 Tax=Candidatus Nealsoniibacteriota TaxID=1817911 RepID=A0A2M8DM57_9BACT|nr:MAG: elongation factor 4 [Parcubacteria group bacterium CG2_30_36_18]PIP24647.1 MAG: elongation factor 4 [Candidatus Nealsonbacteria bacterium CG23_combo_of_CG06-09_8_20_14_all_36_125]PIR71970.1 MAG: elongation factor 4 [Candidatus Nealsonbacteria bacterium CG10_big_fil_rev_8_21_14_0_10_36_228]PIX88725.1 MAG: elongation factor 4 [Candidatus Nealsonbacteria bacterium CG_4_10_14_3_um_filter_36_16]PJB98960.1 MAG: elongation factor 4 [Candidatus Nealsonbacteria bacterium CG_4_9_14_0_8_um_filter_
MENFRNFVILSHIDHGKSTLADRFLELTNTIPKEKMRPQYLDMMDLERGRGITIKMHPVRMTYTLNLKPYTLNLIDTPGHVDFSYEVSRSLAAVEGAILLVDATKGIQAQTLANLDLAKRQNLVIIPAVNKIDSPQAKIGETKTDLAKLLNIPEGEVFEISAKYGTNVEKLLQDVIEKIPCPKGNSEKPLRALIFDSKYDPFKGVVAFVRVIDGKVSSGEKIYLIQTKTEGEAKEVGYFKPELGATGELKAGETGYIATGIKEPEKVRVGETITKISNLNIEALPGYQTPKPMVFASIYPENPDDFETLKTALSQLKLNDAALTFEAEMKEALGRGFRCGFLGTLHAEIVSERLRREFGLDLVISNPSVVFKVINEKDREIFVYSPQDFPNQSKIKAAQEPWLRLEIITPTSFTGKIAELLKSLNGIRIETKYFSLDRLLLIYEVPLKEIIVGFYDKLKGMTQGFASMNYEILGYRPANLVKLEILIAGEKEEAFSKIVSEKDAFFEGKRMVEKLKEILPVQLFSVPIQASISGKIIARETMKAKRRDVIAPLYGGDYTRKRKLLEKQKKGKKELKEKGRIRIPPRVFLEMFRD